MYQPARGVGFRGWGLHFEVQFRAGLWCLVTAYKEMSSNSLRRRSDVVFGLGFGLTGVVVECGLVIYHTKRTTRSLIRSPYSTPQTLNLNL